MTSIGARRSRKCGPTAVRHPPGARAGSWARDRPARHIVAASQGVRSVCRRWEADGWLRSAVGCAQWTRAAPRFPLHSARRARLGCVAERTGRPTAEPRCRRIQIGLLPSWRLYRDLGTPSKVRAMKRPAAKPSPGTSCRTRGLCSHSHSGEARTPSSRASPVRARASASQPAPRRVPRRRPTAPPHRWSRHGTAHSGAPSFRRRRAAANEANSTGSRCTSPTFCVAVGAVQSRGREHALIETWSGAAWHAREAPAVRGTTSSGLSGVSCLSASDCVAGWVLLRRRPCIRGTRIRPDPALERLVMGTSANRRILG